MSISYNKLRKLLDKKGLSVGTLISLGVIKDFSGRKIRKDEPVSLEHIDSICQYLDVPIEDVVEIIPDDKD